MNKEQERWFVYGYLTCLIVDGILLLIPKLIEWLGEEAEVYTIEPKKPLDETNHAGGETGVTRVEESLTHE